MILGGCGGGGWWGAPLLEPSRSDTISFRESHSIIIIITISHVTSCHVMSRHVMSCHVMSCHVMSCHVTSCHVMSCHVMSCHVMSCHAMSCHVTSCHVMSCHAMSCHVIVFMQICWLCDCVEMGLLLRQTAGSDPMGLWLEKGESHQCECM